MDTVYIYIYSTELCIQESILAGSDEEHALVKALKYAFPTSRNMYCMIHCKDNLHHFMTKIGVQLDHREKILGMIIGANRITVACDDVQVENQTAEDMQYVCVSNLTDELTQYLQNKIMPEISNNLNIMWAEKWVSPHAWNNNNSESINLVLKMAVDWTTPTTAFDHCRLSFNYRCARC